MVAKLATAIAQIQIQIATTNPLATMKLEMKECQITQGKFRLRGKEMIEHLHHKEMQAG